MGYEVTVKGNLRFRDVDGFKREFEKIARHRQSEVGLHGDFDYFFTKMWGDNLEFLEVDSEGKVDVQREGKLWYDEEKAMKFLSKFASGMIECEGEDGCRWRYVIDENGNYREKKVKK